MNEIPRLLSVQNPAVSKSRFYSPSTFPRSRKCCGRNCTLCTLKEFENILKKSFNCCLTAKASRYPNLSCGEWRKRDTLRKQWNYLRPELCFEDVWLFPLCPRRVLAETFMVLIEGWGLSRTLFLKLCHEQGLTKIQEVNWCDSWHHISLGLKHHLQVKMLD